MAEALKNEPGVVFSTDYQYMCSQSGQNMIKEAVAEHRLTGIVVCSCSPRMHEATFRKTAQAAGLNPYMVEIANIREQCSWVHKDMPVGTEKAIILAKAAVAKVNLNAPLTPGESPVTKRALVIGGGIAGIQTALDIADAGFPVDIVETKPTIGGKMAQLDKTFPTLDCAACILTPKMVDVAQNDKIRIFSYSEVTDVKGFVGNFDVTIKRKARYVKEDVCTGCGLCTEKCPQKNVPNEFNLGMDNRRAIYIPFAQAVPKVATIDPNYCTMLKTGKCGVCSKVCTAGAIDYNAKDEYIEERYGAIVAATGFNPISMEAPRAARCSAPPTASIPIPLYSYSVWAPAAPPASRRARNTAPKYAVCIRQSTPCLSAISTRIQMCMYSISMCVPPARTSTSSTAAPLRNTVCTT